MAGTIVQLPTAPVQQVTDPVYAYKSDNGAFAAEFAPTIGTADAVKFTSKGYAFGWKPDNVVYIDASGNMDIIVGVNAAAVAQVWNNRVSYVGTSAMTSDIFETENTQLKHIVRMDAPPRLPAGYVGTPAQVASGGTITYDSTLSIYANGQVQTTDFEVTGDIGFKDANGDLVYTLPMIVSTDVNGQTVNGTYKVTFNADSTISFYGMVPWDWLQSAVYPVEIDPTVVVAAAYSTAGNGGRKIVRLSNNWIVACVYNSSGLQMIYYVSKDNGSTWSQLCYTSRQPSDWAIASNGTTVYTIMSISSGFSANGFWVFDAATQSNTDPSLTIYNPDTGQTSFGTGTSLAVDSTGAIHAAWCSKNVTYPNSFNIRYSKSTDGGVTWATPTQITTDNTGLDTTEPSISVTSSNNPIILATFDGQAIESKVFNGTAWSNNGIFGGSYTQDSTIIAIDGTGAVHAFWHGTDTTYTTAAQIKYSKSTDGGVTWSAAVNLTTTASYTAAMASVVVAPTNNDIYVFYQSPDASSGGYNNIYMLKYTASAGTWGSPAKLTNDTTNHAQYPAAIWSLNNMNSNDAIRYIYEDMQAGAVEYASIPMDTAPNAPVLTAHANFPANQSATFGWAFSDPDPGDTPSAYQLQIYDIIAATTVVDTGKAASTGETCVLPANTLTNGKQYQFRVTTWDSTGLQGPWSSYSTFNVAAAPTAIFTSPLSGATITSSSLTATWSYSDPGSYAQQSYREQLYDSAGTTLLWDSNTVTSANTAQTIGYTLADSTTYTLKITVTNSQGISSSVVSETFSTSFTAPTTPTIAVSAQTSYVSIGITNPAPSGSQPITAYNDVHRRETGTTSWTRIATDITLNSQYSDYAIMHGQSYDYKCTSVGNNATSVDSATQSASVTLTDIWLHDPADPPNTIAKFTRREYDRTDQWTYKQTLMHFEGREFPVADMADLIDRSIQVTIDCPRGSTDRATLEALAARRTTLLYRDAFGRKMYGVISILPETEQFYGDQVKLQMDAVDYTESA